MTNMLSEVYWNCRHDYELRRFERWLDEQLAQQEAQEEAQEVQIEIFEPPVPTTVIVIQNPDDISLGVPYKSEKYCIHDGQEPEEENV